METDAFLILVLSGYVVPLVGPWVLLIGLARYLLVPATVVWPWLAGSVPTRPWTKVVAAIQGIVLTVVAADVLPIAWAQVLLVAALAAARRVVRSRGGPPVAAAPREPRPAVAAGRPRPSTPLP